jgi:hypothetical protein
MEQCQAETKDVPQSPLSQTQEAVITERSGLGRATWCVGWPGFPLVAPVFSLLFSAGNCDELPCRGADDDPPPDFCSEVLT